MQIADLLRRVVGPLVSQGEAQPPRSAGRIDHVAADDFRLFASVEGEGGDLERRAMTAEHSPITFVEPLRRLTANASSRLAPLEPSREHPGGIGRGGRLLCRLD